MRTRHPDSERLRKLPNKFSVAPAAGHGHRGLPGTAPRIYTRRLRLDDLPQHAANHENGGSDEINVAGLSGELADPQPPKAHSLPFHSDWSSDDPDNGDVPIWDEAAGEYVPGPPSGGAHALLSALHSDTTPAAVTRGGLVTGQGASPAWALLAKGTQYYPLVAGADELAWAQLTNTGIAADAVRVGRLCPGDLPFQQILGFNMIRDACFDSLQDGTNPDWWYTIAATNITYTIANEDGVAGRNFLRIAKPLNTGTPIGQAFPLFRIRSNAWSNNAYIPIERTKQYTVRLWARGYKSTTGVLDASLMRVYAYEAGYNLGYLATRQFGGDITHVSGTTWAEWSGSIAGSAFTAGTRWIALLLWESSPSDNEYNINIDIGGVQLYQA